MSRGDDEGFMRMALALAARGRGCVEPNPMAGAVIVDRGKVIGRGYHRRFGGPHAEINAIRNCRRSCRGATIYITLEPCDKYGKTPPCTDALIEVGLAEVVYACADPLQGTGPAKLRRAGIKVRPGLLEAEALRLNAPFFKLARTGLPYVIAKWAMSLDGRATTGTRDHWISSPDSRLRVQRIRSHMDAIVVGLNTVLSDDPLLMSALPGPRRPVRIVPDSTARTPCTSRLVRTARECPVIIATTRLASATRANRLRRLGCEVLALPSEDGAVSLPALLRNLGERRMTNVLLEGGPALLSSAFRHKLVDKVIAFIAPSIIGAVGTKMAVDAFRPAGQGQMGLSEHVIRRLGKDVMVEGLMPRRWR